MRIQVVGTGLDKKAIRAIRENHIQLLSAKLVSRNSGDSLYIAECAATEPGLGVPGG